MNVCIGYFALRHKGYRLESTATDRRLEELNISYTDWWDHKIASNSNEITMNRITCDTFRDRRTEWQILSRPKIIFVALDLSDWCKCCIFLCGLERRRACWMYYYTCYLEHWIQLTPDRKWVANTYYIGAQPECRRLSYRSVSVRSNKIDFFRSLRLFIDTPLSLQQWKHSLLL